jgi:hypothetical protein
MQSTLFPFCGLSVTNPAVKMWMISFVHNRFNLEQLLKILFVKQSIHLQNDVAKMYATAEWWASLQNLTHNVLSSK